MQRWSWLKRWGVEVARRRGKLRAQVAGARRVAVIMHRMWIKGVPFRGTRLRPRRQLAHRRKGSSNQHRDHGIRFGGCVRQDVGPGDIAEHSVAAALLAVSTTFWRLMRRTFFWPKLAAASAPTAERRMKPACRTIGRERQRLEDIAPNNPISEECSIPVPFPPTLTPIADSWR